MKTVYVSKITITSYNKLKEYGYNPIVIQVAKTPSPHAKYKYLRPETPSCTHKGKSEPQEHPNACKVNHAKEE